eukprot:13111912-Heterocapsa_arctica.AAC.1
MQPERHPFEYKPEGTPSKSKRNVDSHSTSMMPASVTVASQLSLSIVRQLGRFPPFGQVADLSHGKLFSSMFFLKQGKPRCCSGRLLTI